MWMNHSEVQFHMWEISHLLTILSISILLFAFFYFRKSLRPYRRMIRITVGLLLIASRISLDIWYVVTGTWDLKSSLPLELCSIASLMCALMLLTKSYRLFEIFYFIAIGGAIQAIISPNLDFGFPLYRYIQFFLDHFLLLLAPLIMIWLYHYTITKKSIGKAFFFLNALAVIVLIINYFTSANYMFLMHKPNSASLLDVLGPHPYYLLSLEGIVFIIFFILYVPFARKKSK